MAISAIKKKIIKQCKNDPEFFIENFCKIVHPSLGVVPLKLFSYQKTALNAYRKHRFNLYKKCRQAGVSTLTGSFALWFGMFHSNKTILVVSKRDDDAKDFLRKNIRFPYDHLPEWLKELYPLDPGNEHCIGFPNNSRITSLTSAPETLRSQSASLNIIDEAAFIECMEEMWAGGQQCVALDSMVATERGTVAIGDIINDAKLKLNNVVEIDGKVFTDNGMASTTHLLNNGYGETRKIITSLGYEIECTLDHKLRILDPVRGYMWKRAKSIKEGDIACLIQDTCGNDNYIFDELILDDIDLDKYRDENEEIDIECHSCYGIVTETVKSLRDRNIKNEFTCQICENLENGGFLNPEMLNDAFAELLGYYMGNGINHMDIPGRISLLVDKKDDDLLVRLTDLLNSFGMVNNSREAHDLIEIQTFSLKFLNFLIYNRINGNTSHDYNAKLPSPFFYAGKNVLAAYLRGLFEALGCVASYSDVGFIVCLSNSEKLMKHVQIALLSLGIISKRESIPKKEGLFDYAITIIDSVSRRRFLEVVGFMSTRKNEQAAAITNDNYISIIEHSMVSDFGDVLCKCCDEDDADFDYGLQYSETSTILYSEIQKYIKKYPELIDTELGKLVVKGIIFDTVKAVRTDSTITADISVPENNTYIANGFISHNTMMHGGRLIVISTPKGVGNWYHYTWEAAQSSMNNFNPIVINWWDMDWQLEYKDELSNQINIISPTLGIRKCKDPEEIEKYGPFWSPWLEEQVRDLELRGETHLYRQEILAEFLGSGDTVINRAALVAMDELVSDQYREARTVNYVNPRNNEVSVLDFMNKLHIWNMPVRAGICPSCGNIGQPNEKCKSCQSVVSAETHSYCAGVDVSTGEATDFSAIVILDTNTGEQAAELQIKVSGTQLARMADYLGRFYNNAFLVVENIGYGKGVVQELYDELMYSNMYSEMPVGKTIQKQRKQKTLGFGTTKQKKSLLCKALIDCTGEKGLRFYSSRLVKECKTFVHLGGGKVGAEPGNNDDIVIAAALACWGLPYALSGDYDGLIPLRNFEAPQTGIPALDDQNRPIMLSHFTDSNDKNLLPPIFRSSEDVLDRKGMIQAELGKFAQQISGKNGPDSQKIVVERKNVIRLRK